MGGAVAERGTPDQARDFVFLISQIGDKGSPERRRADEISEFVVTPAAKRFELQVSRSDLDPTPGMLTTQIIKGIINARVVVADLTGRNPNVFFELGVAQSFGKALVMLVKDPQALPFDVKGERTIAVGDGEVLGVSEARDAEAALVESLRIVLEEGYQPSNLVTEVASARSLDAMAPENPMATEVGALREMVEEIQGGVRRLVAIRRPSSPAVSDFRILREFVEQLAASNRLMRGELEELVGEDTTNGFDRWVAQTEERTSQAEDEAARVNWVSTQGDEEPF